MRSYVEMFIEIYSQTRPAFGAADICLADSPQSAERAAAFAVVMFLGRTETREYGIRRVVVLMPPEMATPMVTDVSITACVIDAAQNYFGRSLSDQELSAVHNRLILARAQDFTIESAIRAITTTAASNDTAIVLHAAGYRAAQETPGAPAVSPTLIACVYAVAVGIDVAQLWQETYLFIRILRDLHLFDAARSVLTRLRSASSLTESPVQYERRLTTLDLGIELNQMSQCSDYNMGHLSTLTERIERHCLELRAAGEEVSPALSLLVHCIHLAKLRGYPVSEEALSTVHTLLPDAPAALGDLITAVARPDSGGRTLLALGKSLQAARSHEDIGFDLAHVAIAARRLLDTEVGIRNVEAVMLAIEALADHAIRTSSIGTEASVFSSLGTTRERAASVSATGCRVTLLGLSETGRLVRVDTADGDVVEVVTETREVFSAAALENWSQQFPYAYAQTDDPNAFWTSTDKLGLTLVPSGPIVLVMDTSLQRFPANLIRLGQEFVGCIVPVGMAPSISWLTEIRKLPTPADRPRKGWISTDTTPRGDPALSWLAGRLQDCFDHHSFTVDNGSTLPDDLSNSELVVIAAHGGLLPEGRFIQRVAANVDAAMYPATLASAIGDAGVVILFICSGGRIDPHPQAETTVGLVKHLLDEGCWAVVASPWPLDVKVPPRWLPKFLERWSEGDTVMEAVFHANAEAARWFGGDPVDCLAMNVYGDPLRRRGC
jgi:hypothetical protein